MKRFLEVGNHDDANTRRTCASKRKENSQGKSGMAGFMWIVADWIAMMPMEIAFAWDSHAFDWHVSNNCLCTKLSNTCNTTGAQYLESRSAYLSTSRTQVLSVATIFCYRQKSGSQPWSNFAGKHNWKKANASSALLQALARLEALEVIAISIQIPSSIRRGHFLCHLKEEEGVKSDGSHHRAVIERQSRA